MKGCEGWQVKNGFERGHEFRTEEGRARRGDRPYHDDFKFLHFADRSKSGNEFREKIFLQFSAEKNVAEDSEAAEEVYR